MLSQSLNSPHFLNLVAQGQGDVYVGGDYHFHTLQSGISLHGGRFVAQKNLHISRLVGSYVNFIILLEGCLDFSINQHRYQIYADGGRVVMVAAAEESVFCRYLRQGESTVKLAIKGVDNWLAQSAFAHLQSMVFAQSVRDWRLGDSLKQQALRCLQQNNGGLAGVLNREAEALALLAALWQNFEMHEQQQSRAPVVRPSESLVAQLNHAYQQGHTQVTALAQALHCSPRTLQRRIRQQFGLTASEWLRHKHMQYALQALKARNQSIGEIAYHCGYRHPSNFTQAFKQYFHCTPAQLKHLSEKV